MKEIIEKHYQVISEGVDSNCTVRGFETLREAENFYQECCKKSVSVKLQYVANLKHRLIGIEVKK